MSEAGIEFWFDFASTYSYVAAMRIEGLCEAAGVRLAWRPFQLGPIFVQQGWNTSPFNVNRLRGAYMWRDMERLTAKFHLPWKRPTEFPRRSVLPARIAAAHADAPWIGTYVRAIYVTNFGDDAAIEDERAVEIALRAAGVDPDPVIVQATTTPLGSRLRENTERAMSLGIFGAPNCVIDREIFWGEETLEDAIDWALAHHTGSPAAEEAGVAVLVRDNARTAGFENHSGRRV